MMANTGQLSLHWNETYLQALLPRPLLPLLLQIRLRHLPPSHRIWVIDQRQQSSISAAQNAFKDLSSGKVN